MGSARAFLAPELAAAAAGRSSSSSELASPAAAASARFLLALRNCCDSRGEGAASASLFTELCRHSHPRTHTHTPDKSGGRVELSALRTYWRAACFFSFRCPVFSSSLFLLRVCDLLLHLRLDGCGDVALLCFQRILRQSQTTLQSITNELRSQRVQLTGRAGRETQRNTRRGEHRCAMAVRAAAVPPAHQSRAMLTLSACSARISAISVRSWEGDRAAGEDIGRGKGEKGDTNTAHHCAPVQLTGGPSDNQGRKQRTTRHSGAQVT